MVSFNSCLACKNNIHQGNRSYPSKQKEKFDQSDEPSKITPPLDVQTQLMDAVAEGQIAKSSFIQLLEQGKILPTAKDGQGRSTIQHIIYQGTAPEDLNAILEQLKKQFPDQEVANQEIAKVLNTPDNSSRKDTAFIAAVEKMGEKRDEAFIRLVDILYKNGAQPGVTEQKRSLLYCIKLSDLETAETKSGVALFNYLVQKFQHSKMPLDLVTARAVASAAAQVGNNDLVKSILENPAIFPINAATEDEKGNTLLHDAASGNKNGAHVIQLLLEQANLPEGYINQINRAGETALHVAVRQGSLAAVRMLIANKAVNIGLKNQVGQTPFDLTQDLINQQPLNDRLVAIKKIFQRSSRSQFDDID